MMNRHALDTRGVQRAIERYGEPAKRCYTLPMTEESLAYWERVLSRRRAEVVFLIQRTNDLYITHTKASYPKGIYRLPSGGIEPGEDLLSALWREVTEETNLSLQIEDFLAIIHYRFIHGEQSLSFTSYVFSLREDEACTLCATDPEEEITGFRENTLAEVGALAEELASLSGEWRDWGRFRAVAHRVVEELLIEEE
ncbi:MAG: NUDIX domain-containing protein [Anaerolineales bacterium]